VIYQVEDDRSARAARPSLKLLAAYSDDGLDGSPERLRLGKAWWASARTTSAAC
jgi:hypothetical protein